MRKNTVTARFTHTTAKKATEELKISDSGTKQLLLRPITRPASTWTGKPARERLRQRLHWRTRELAVLAGHKPLDITQRDYEQAKRDVTGETNPDRQNAILNAVT